MLMSGLRLSNLNKESTYLLTYLLTSDILLYFGGRNAMALNNESKFLIFLTLYESYSEGGS